MTTHATRGRWLGLTAMVFALLVVGLDAMVLNVALPSLASQLGASTTELQWLTDSYTLAFAGLLLPAGVLGDRFGRKRFLIGAIVLFGAASVLAAYATSPQELIWTRAVMGVGAAAIMPLTLSVLPSMFAKEERPKAVAVLTAAVAVGLPLGPLVGGWMLQHFWWGSVFLLNVPVAAIAVAGVAALVPESANPTAPRLDLVGTVLSVLAITGLVYGIIELPTNDSALVSLAAGLVALIAFFVWERRTADPLVDLNLFKNRRFAAATGAATGATFVMLGTFFVLPLYLQAVTGADAMGTGLRLLPLVAGLLVGGLTSEKIAARFGVRGVVTAGLLLLGTGMLLLALIQVDTGYGLVGTALGVAGIGLGAAMAPAMDTVLGELPEHQTGVGSALASTCRQVGAALAVAILGSLLNSIYTGRLAGTPPPAQENIAAALTVADQTGNTELARLAKESYVAGMSTVMWVCVAVCVLVAVGFAASMANRAVARESVTIGV